MLFCCVNREQIEACGHRELLEETGLRMKNHVVDGVLNVVWTGEKLHYVVIIMNGEVADDMEPVTKEPHKCQGID
jgi:8-oxo-dGTP pyrophosphatase MutT (NUDIX family)